MSIPSKITLLFWSQLRSFRTLKRQRRPKFSNVIKIEKFFSVSRTQEFVYYGFKVKLLNRQQKFEGLEQEGFIFPNLPCMSKAFKNRICLFSYISLGSEQNGARMRV